jgi:hypothetical protein
MLSFFFRLRNQIDQPKRKRIKRPKWKGVEQ